MEHRIGAQRIYRGILEGLASKHPSVGLGKHDVTFDVLPAQGESFHAWVQGLEHWGPLVTTPVVRLRWLSRREVRFITRNTMYVLRVQVDPTP